MRLTNGSGSGGDVAVAGGATAASAVGIYVATTTSQAGPIIAGVVAIFVALVTWYATDRRQANALVAERDRLDKQLAAENERHRETLAHERDAQELDELRRVLDDATSALAAANIQTADAVWKWRQLPSGLAPAKRSALAAATTEAVDSVIASGAAWYRVTLRLGDEHPVSLSLREVNAAIHELGLAINTSDPPSDAEKVRITELENARKDRLDEFRKAAVEEVGSRLGR